MILTVERSKRPFLIPKVSFYKKRKRKNKKWAGTIGEEINKINQSSVFVSKRNIISDRCHSSSKFLASWKLKLKIVKLNILFLFVSIWHFDAVIHIFLDLKLLKPGRDSRYFVPNANWPREANILRLFKAGTLEWSSWMGNLEISHCMSSKWYTYAGKIN